MVLQRLTTHPTVLATTTNIFYDKPNLKQPEQEFQDCKCDFIFDTAIFITRVVSTDYRG